MSHAGIVVMLELGVMPVMVRIAVVFDLITQFVASPDVLLVIKRFVLAAFAVHFRLTVTAATNPTSAIVVIVFVVPVGRMLIGVLVKHLIAAPRIDSTLSCSVIVHSRSRRRRGSALRGVPVA